MLFAEANTDESIARLIHGMFGFELSENTVYGAREAIHYRLPQGMLAIIMRKIHQWIQMDETKYRRGDGKYGLGLGRVYAYCGIHPLYKLKGGCGT